MLLTACTRIPCMHSELYQTESQLHILIYCFKLEQISQKVNYISTSYFL